MQVIPLEIWNSHCINAITNCCLNIQVKWQGIQIEEKENLLWFQKLRIWVMSYHLILHFQGMLGYAAHLSIYTQYKYWVLDAVNHILGCMFSHYAHSSLPFSANSCYTEPYSFMVLSMIHLNNCMNFGQYHTMPSSTVFFFLSRNYSLQMLKLFGTSLRWILNNIS